MRPVVRLAVAFGLAVFPVASILATHVCAASLTLDPDLVYLGSLSGGDRADDDAAPTATELRIESADDWCLELRLADSPRRIADAVVLPLERLRRIHLGLPEALLDGGSSVVMRGKGASSPCLVTLDWSFVQNALQTYVQPEDPPGDYQITLSGRLLDAEADQPLTGPTNLVLEFRIRQWLGFAEAITDSRINVYGIPGEGESGATVIPLTANCGWTLSVAATSDLVRDDGLIVISAGSLAVAVPERGGYGEWTPVQYGWVPLGGPLLLARGTEPAAFTLNKPGVPLMMKLATEHTPPAGIYHMTLSVSLASDVAARE
jgi:hypothetical protein